MLNKDSILNLLKKGKRGIISVAFSRTGIVLVLLVVQFLTLFSLFKWFGNLIPHFFGGTALFTFAVTVYLINSKIDPTGKITWLALISVLPVFGALLFLFTILDFGHNALRKSINNIFIETRNLIPQDKETYDKLKETNDRVSKLTDYINRNGCHPVSQNTDVHFFPLGDDKWPVLLEELKKAKDFIFMEYFIIEEGEMWGSILKILSEKAKEGVDVRVMYDGTCELTTLPRNYPRKLKNLGIKCKMFAPVLPFVSTHYNYRDHRKICVIDGKVAFNGGVNLADEYINKYPKHGHWKDSAVMLKGEAVKNFTLMFLQMWNIDEKTHEYQKYLDIKTDIKADGFVEPFGDYPLDNDLLSEKVYMDMINRATNYLHIYTPYLILDGKMETALKFAAERGVDVSIIMPGIPDKKLPYALAKTHYASLLDSGVKIYEYTPGFVHAKIIIADDIEGIVGTINLDYRSFYHHFECGTWMYQKDVIKTIEEDYQNNLKKCRQITKETIWSNMKGYKTIGRILKFIAPLL